MKLGNMKEVDLNWQCVFYFQAKINFSRKGFVCIVSAGSNGFKAVLCYEGKVSAQRNTWSFDWVQTHT